MDDTTAVDKTYTARKHFYTLAQISKFVRPGAQRIGVSGSVSSLTPLLAFYHSGLGQITIVGINTSGSAATLSGTLASLPVVPLLDLYYTSATANLATGGSVAVNNGTFSATIPADCVFTLTGFNGVNVALTNPVNGAQFTAPATIPLAATATTTAGSIALVWFYNGVTPLGEATVAPYGFTWHNVPMGNYALTAVAGDTLEHAGTSAVVNVTVAGPLARIAVTPATAAVVPGGTQRFSATAADLMGHVLNPQPAFSWSVSGGGTIDGTGLFTAGRLVGGPFSVAAASGRVRGVASVSVAAVRGGTIGNTNEGTSTDTMWSNGAWINACQFQAGSNMVVSTMHAKVGAISGGYKCAIYTDNGGSPSAWLGGTAEVRGPADGWNVFALTQSLVLTNGQYYWLAIWSDDTNAAVYYSDTSGNQSWGQYNYGTWPNPITTTGGGTLDYCIYAVGSSGPAPTLTSIAVTPANPTNSMGTTQQFTATGTYSDSSTQNITSPLKWMSSSTGVATINASGLAKGVTAGTTTISATLGRVSGHTTLTILPPPLAITTTSLLSGVVSTIYTTRLAASGGIVPYTWSLAGGALPPGLTLSSIGAISGKPTTNGTSSFTVRATSARTPAQTATCLLSITINPASTNGLIGNTTEGTLTDALWYSRPYINASRFQAASNMMVSTMQAKVAAISGKYKCAIYSDVSGLPSRLLGSTAEVSNPASGWQSFPLTSSVALTKGSYYWLAIWSDDANARVYYSANTGTLRASPYNYGTWPDPISTTVGSSRRYCIYATQ